MRPVKADTVNADNERYGGLLNPNGWSMSAGDWIINSLTASKGAGTSKASTALAQLKDGGTIWVIGDELQGCNNLTISNHTNGTPWHINGVKIRLLSTKQFVIKKDPASPYAALKLFGPQLMDADFGSVQLNGRIDQPPILIDVEGVDKNHNIQIMLDGENPHLIFKHWGTKNGGFSGLRALEGAIAQYLSGEISDFYISAPYSEGIYIGVRLNPHCIFRNFALRNGLIVYPGTEALQIENFGEGCVTEDITIIQSASQAISPFQNYQRGTIQYKAGPGSSKVRRIYVQGYGDTVFTAVSDGSKPGDIIEISDIYAPQGDGHFFYANASCNQGARWEFSNIFVGGASKRIGQETQHEVPYAFLADVNHNVTDKLIFKSIITDKSLPLTRNAAKYTIENHTIVDEIPKAKFVSPPIQFGDKVLGYYNLYNQVSQKQFYPVAGQPAQYRKGDVVYWDNNGVRRWFKLNSDQLGSPNGPTDAIQIPSPVDNYEQAPDSPIYGKAGFIQTTIEPTIEDLKLEIMALQTAIAEIKAQLDVLAQEAITLEAEKAAETQAKEEAQLKLGTINTLVNQFIQDLKDAGLIA